MNPLTYLPQYDNVLDVDETDTINPKWKQNIWSLTKSQLEELTEYDKSLLGVQPDTPIPLIARLYVAYSTLIKQIDEVWGNTIQYQKNEAMRKFLDAALLRFVELKLSLVDLSLSEFYYVDEQLIELKLIPEDVDIINLNGYPIEQSDKIKELAKRLFKGERIWIDKSENEEAVEGEEENEEQKKKKKRPIVEKKFNIVDDVHRNATMNIQRHERARCGRLEFLDEKNLYLIRILPRKKPPPIEAKTAAAINIQRLWNGYRVRRDMRSRKFAIRMLINMDIPSWKSTAVQDKAKEVHQLKKQQRKDKIKDFIETSLKEKTRILKVMGPGLMEDIGDEIRYWFRNWYDVALAFDRYPTIEEGGTIMVISGQTQTPEEYRAEQERIRRLQEQIAQNPALAQKMKADEAKRLKEEAEKKKKEKERLKKEKKEAKLRAKQGIVDPFKFKEMPGHQLMQTAEDEYAEKWTNLDEDKTMDNNNLIMDKITSDKCCEVQLEIRKMVDTVMRLELELLRTALATDQGKVPQPVKQPKPKKQKVPKDITANRQFEDLFQELYDKGVIRQYPKTDLNSFIGDYGYKNFELVNLEFDPYPSIGEVKQTVIRNCIIPLSGQNIPKAKSVLICGPKQCGKKLLVNAICTATSAVLFDLSPKVTAEIYTTKKELNLLVHLVNKMSKLLQPSVIFIEGAEKIFYKAVPKQETGINPKKLQRVLAKKIVNIIKPEDRVMVIGISNQPWAAQAGKMIKAFGSYIMIPRTDYGTCYQLWMDILMKYHGVQRDLDVSAIAKISIGYSVPYIREVAAKVLCPARIIRLKYEPLHQHELLEGLMRMGQPNPVTQEEQTQFDTFYRTKTKIGKKKAKIIQAANERREAERLKKEAEAQKKKK